MRFYTTGQIKGKYVINTSPSGGVFFLRPDSEKFKLYDEGKIEFSEYAIDYLFRMRSSYQKNRDLWDWLFKNNSTIIFGCDYRQSRVEESHLLELIRILKRLGGEYLGHLTGAELKRRQWIADDQII